MREKMREIEASKIKPGPSEISQTMFATVSLLPSPRVPPPHSAPGPNGPPARFCKAFGGGLPVRRRVGLGRHAGLEGTWGRVRGSEQLGHTCGRGFSAAEKAMGVCVPRAVARPPPLVRPQVVPARRPGVLPPECGVWAGRDRKGGG